jgi:hypothetical protein
MLVTFYGPDGLREVLRDGEPVEVDAFPEAGWMAHGRYDNLPPGQSVTYRVEFELGPVTDDVDDPVLWEQPLATAYRSSCCALRGNAPRQWTNLAKFCRFAVD